MDYQGLLKGLYAERDRLLSVIAKLEAISGQSNRDDPGRRSRRGRKSMGAAERRAVSERMKRYWAARRKARATV